MTWLINCFWIFIILYLPGWMIYHLLPLNWRDEIEYWIISKITGEY